MPSNQPLPTILEMLNGAAGALWARRQIADGHDGSLYDVQAGVGAILWVREAVRDRDSFRACFDDWTTGDLLESRIVRKGGPARIVASRGTGQAQLQRDSAPEMPGIFLAGTRIGVAGLGSVPRFYRLTSNTLTTGYETGLLLAIEAAEPGDGVSIDTTKLSDPRMWWEDIVLEPSWRIVSVVCSEGTCRETDQEYRARWRQSRIDRRVGYRKALSDALVAAGASYVVLLESDYADGSDDLGINRAFVADSTFQSPDSLLRACRLAADEVRVLGCDLTVWGITRTLSSFNLTATLWSGVGEVDQAAVRTSVQDGVLHYFSARDNGFCFKRDGLGADVLRSTPEVQSLDFGGTDPSDTVIANLMESTVLPFLFTERNLINVTLANPS